MTEKLKITPGPWPLGMEDLRGGRYWVVSRPGRDESIDLHEDDNGEADARAIAALPGLIEAAEKLLESDGNPWDAAKYYEAKIALRAALNSIKGGDNE